MGRSVESDLLRLALAAGFVAACNAEPIATPTRAIEPTRTPFPTTTETDSPKPTKTFTPTATLSPTDTLTPIPSRTIIPTIRPTIPVFTPDFRTPSLCGLKPRVTQETIDYLYSFEVFTGANRKVVLLTYDDFDSEGQINKVLNALAKFGAKATFFVNGPIFDIAPNAVKRIVAEGHVLGVHGNKHVVFPNLTREQIDDDLCQFMARANKIVPGYDFKYFRFPYGARSVDSRWQIASWGLASVGWSAESGGGTAQNSYNNVVNNLSNGKVFLLHLESGGDVEASEQTIRKIIESGYAVESVATGLR